MLDRWQSWSIASDLKSEVPAMAPWVRILPCPVHGQIPKWPNGEDCKSSGLRLQWFESTSAQLLNY